MRNVNGGVVEVVAVGVVAVAVGREGGRWSFFTLLFVVKQH